MPEEKKFYITPSTPSNEASVFMRFEIQNLIPPKDMEEKTIRYMLQRLFDRMGEAIAYGDTNILGPNKKMMRFERKYPVMFELGYEKDKSSIKFTLTASAKGKWK